MRKFLKTFIVFIYLLLAVFIQPSSVLASENLLQNSSQQYFVSSTKSETTTLSRKEKEYYTVFENRNRAEIINSSGKNNYLGFGSFDKANVKYNITNYFINNEITYPVCISHNISPNLKNAIYTRAP